MAALLLAYEALYAPAHWLAEAVNVLWSKVQFGDLTVGEGEERMDLLLRAPIQSSPIGPLMKDAFAISIGNGVTVYDSLYIALAVEKEVSFVTADIRLLRKVTDEGLSPLMRWVGDLRPGE